MGNWKRSETDSRRVIIVDFQHLAYSYAFGGATALSSTLNIDGVPTVVDTTIPAYTIKTLHRWADGGRNPLAVCFDSKDCARSRKAYFEQFKNETDECDALTDDGYKASRESQDGKFYDGINITANILYKAGISCFKAEGYEADDLVFACVKRCKELYPDLPIDVFTGDADLLPLVDDQVSVFHRSRKSTWAEDKSIERPHYFQVRPYNFQSYVEGLTSYKTIKVPYNTLLLAKLLRGDKSDGVTGKKDWKPKMYGQLLDLLEEDGYDLGELFRYGENTETYVYRDTQEPIPEDLIATTTREQMMIKYGDPVELTRLCDILSNYVEEKDINHIRNVYRGINLNTAFVNVPERFKRRPAKLTNEIKGYDMVKLATEVSVLKIRLPLV